MSQSTDLAPSLDAPLSDVLSESTPEIELDLWKIPEARLGMWEFTVENANDPVLITSTDLARPGPRIVYVNRAFTRMTGYAAGEVLGLSPRILQGPDTDRNEMERMRTELEAGRPFVGQTINYTKDGQPYHMEWSVYGLRDKIGALLYYVAVQRDISARKRYESQIEAQAHLLGEANEQLAQANMRLAALSLTDSLTGICNHRAFHQKLGEEIARATRYNTPLSLLLLDIDHFKEFNDVFGHPAGDEALRQVAEMMKKGGRQSDTTARQGGEEFAVLLPQTDHPGALAFAEGLRAAIEGAHWPLRAVTVSIGTATFDTFSPENFGSEATPVKTASDLIDRADKALYNAKSSGRNCIR